MKELHHANVIANRENCRDFIFDILNRDLNFDVNANPDFLLIENQSFGIDDARDLKRWVIGKPLANKIKVSLIVTKTITHEAQNALLKVLEEPPIGTYIFISLESLGGLLSTFISRIKILEVSEDDTKINISQNSAQKFFHSKMKERFSLIRSLSKNKDKSEMKELIKDLEKVCYQDIGSQLSNNPNKAKLMKNILTAKIFASTRGSSPKMLIEWLSCML